MANPQPKKLDNSLPTYEQQVERISSKSRRSELLQRLIHAHHFITISLPESTSDKTYITTFIECDVAHDVLKLDGFDMIPAVLEREWVITIDTPVGGVEPVVKALGNELPLIQGPYDNCLFILGSEDFIEGKHKISMDTS